MRVLARKEQQKDLAKTDLLLRFFESSWFNEWVCLQYLHQSTPDSGIEAYLCNRLLGFPESAVERYLLQYVYLAVSRPGSALERAIVELCSRSFVVALKVHWLLLAISQDTPKPKHIDALRERCERAALEGSWDVPFRNPRLDPLSPQQSAFSPDFASPLLSPVFQPPKSMVMGCSPEAAARTGVVQLPSNSFLGSSSVVATVHRPHTGADSLPGDGTRGNLQIDLGCLPQPEERGLTMLASLPRIITQLPAQQSPSQEQLSEHVQRIREELGEGEGVTALMHRSATRKGAVSVIEDEGVLSDDDVHGGTPVSPTTRLRHDTYGATLDFLEAMCDASNSLTSISQEERQRALRHALEAINKELEKAARRDVPVWFPMGRRNERVLRIPAKEAVILNSREKAPFLMYLEVLETDDDPGPPTGSCGGAAAECSKQAVASDLRVESSAIAGSSRTMSQFTDSARSLVASSTNSSCQAAGASTSAHDEREMLRAGPVPHAAAADAQPAAGPGPSSALVGGSAAVSTGAGVPNSLPPSLIPAQPQQLAAASASAAASTSGAAATSSGTSVFIPHRRRTGSEMFFSSNNSLVALEAAAVASATAGASVPARSRSSMQHVSSEASLAPNLAPSSNCSVSSSASKASGPSPSAGSSVFTGMVRSLCFNEPLVAFPHLEGPMDLLQQQQQQQGAVPAAAAVASQAPIAAAAALHVCQHPVHEPSQQPQQADVPLPGMSTAGLHGRQGPQPHRDLSPEDVNELIHAGCLSSPPSATSTTVMDKMAGAMASLRGEAPLVRLHLRVLQGANSSGSSTTAGHKAIQGGAGSSSAAAATAVSAPFAASSSGSSFSLVLPSLAVNKKSSGGAGISEVSGSPGGSAGSEESSTTAKALSLLSKLGLCRAPAVEEGDSGVASTKSAPARPAERLVAVTLEVAGGVNLAVTSPYRKSRRTPSHEAISLVASKYKILSIPPPMESGPPLTAPMGSASSSEWDASRVDVADASFSRGLNVFAEAAAAAAEAVAARDGAQEGAGEAAGTSSGGGDAACLPNTSSLSFPVAAASARDSGEPSPRLLSGGGIPPAPASSSTTPAKASPAQPCSGGDQPSTSSGATPARSGAEQQQQPEQNLPSRLSAFMMQASVPIDLARSLREASQQWFAGLGAGSSSPNPNPATACSTAPTSGAVTPGALSQGGGMHTAGSSPPMSSSLLSPALSGSAIPPSSVKLDAATEKARKEAFGVYGERWSHKAKRIQRESPQGRRKGWALRCVIVKSGDDCRQELLAVQLVRTFAEIFKEAGLPLWVRCYDVLVTSSRTALIEVVPDSLSIHTVKHRSKPGSSLSDHFFAKFPRGSPECLVAQRKFVESLAAYSLICYLLQIKDRHNGNILIDDEGRLVHIDFGFMLSNSPGGVNFEGAPFKLTRELLEVMDSNSEGKPSEMFDYFKVLLIQGFLACRKHHERILLLVKMMSRSNFPCFKGGERAVKQCEKRFHLSLTEVASVQTVLGLIGDSLDAWRTRQYDYYQRLLNGIL